MNKPAERPDVTLKAQAFYAARKTWEDRKAEVSPLYDAMQKCQHELIDAMLAAGLRSMTMDDGSKPSLCKQVTISVTKDNFDSLRAWLVSDTGDDRDFVEEVVSKPRLLDLVKKRIEAGSDPADFPPELRVSTRPGIRVYGWQGRDDAE